MNTIKSYSRGPISSDDPDAIQKLEQKLKNLQKLQDTMKAVNAWYRKHKALDGCPHLTQASIDKLKADMASRRVSDKPFLSWQLSKCSSRSGRSVPLAVSISSSVKRKAGAVLCLVVITSFGEMKHHAK